MSLCFEGLDSQVNPEKVSIVVPDTHPLIKIAIILPWQKLAELAITDLKNTSKGFWWMGPSLNLRMHLAIFILQARFNLTDRQVAESLRYHAVFQLFSGRFLIKDWRPIVHTAICRFRSRLLPETQRQILIMVVKEAENLGFVDSSWMDLDSTVQEANMSYPSDACMMLRLARNASRIVNCLNGESKSLLPKELTIDITAIGAKAKEYFFLAKNTVIGKRREVFKELHKMVKRAVYPVTEFLQSNNTILPWNYRRQAEQIAQEAKRYLLDVAHFVRTHTIKKGKILSLHLRNVACIRKGKFGKENEFGRVFQLSRIGGNFLIPLACSSVRMEDKFSVLPAIREHIRIFGKASLKSIGTDRGYFSAANVVGAGRLGVMEIGLQCPGGVRTAQSEQDLLNAKRLRDRRAGIEPLIGHAKRFGLGRSRMKGDQSTLASGYRSVLGFNLSQIERHLAGLMKKVA